MLRQKLFFLTPYKERLGVLVAKITSCWVAKLFNSTFRGFGNLRDDISDLINTMLVNERFQADLNLFR